jgi:hypothetical protein
MIKFLLSTLLILLANNSYAWEGYDYEKETDIEIEKGNLVRSGKDIEFYDYEAGEYRDAEVLGIHRDGSKVTIDVYDYDSGENREFEMEDEK